MEFFNERFILKGRFQNLVLVNIFAVMAGIVLLFIIYRSGLHYGLGFFIVGSFILTGWMFVDAIVWYFKGVHELHIDSNGIIIIKGKDRTEISISKEQITDIMVYRKGFRKNLNIMLGNQVMDVPGIITLYPGKRIQMFSDAFEDRDFNEAIDWLGKLHTVKIK